MSAQPDRVPADRLRVLITEAVNAVGAPHGEAAALAGSLVDASLRGVDSHGVNMLLDYLPRIAAGGWAMPSPARVIRQTGAVAVVDGGGGLGTVTAAFAMNEAIQRAGEHGISAVAVRNGSHFGAAGYYARIALRHDMIGLAFTNASPGMAPHGGIEPLLSNNPWSIAIPSEEAFDIVLDISNSVVARSWIRLAAQAGSEIPPGWALGPDGESTTDPHVALAGALVPIAGHKGYGIALMVDILAGVLSGAAFGPGVGAPFPIEVRRNAGTPASYAPQRVGHTLIAIKVEAFRPVEDFKADVSDFVHRLRSSRPAPGSDRVRVPGEPEHETALTRGREGIPVRTEVLAALQQARERSGAWQTVPAPRTSS
jgi:LDH2 family malate/lactate/ureidoglycolate dehydrogenase